MENVTAAGGVLYEPTQKKVVLILRNGLWDLPKGKVEAGESVEECACREVAEEVGIPLPQIQHTLAKTQHQYERNGILYSKTTHWFEMRITSVHSFTPQRAEGIEQVAWTSLEDAHRKIGYANLRIVLELLQKKYL